MIDIDTKSLSEKVIPAMKDSEINLEEAKDILLSTYVPDDFYEYTKIKSMPQNISNIIDKVKEIKKWTYEKIFKFDNVEQKIINDIVQNGNLGEYVAQNIGKVDSELLEVIISEVILRYCKIEADELRRNKVKYSLTEGLIVGDIDKATNFEESRACCATYIASVIYKSGALPEEHMNNYYYHGTADYQFIKMLDDAGWERISLEEVKPGDVCLWTGHVFIYAGDNMIWDQTTGVLRDDGSVPEGQPVEYWEEYSKHDLIIWRPCSTRTTATNLEEGIPDEVKVNLGESTIDTTVNNLGDNNFSD